MSRTPRRRFFLTSGTLLCCVIALTGISTNRLHAYQDSDSPRMTPLVKLIRTIEPAVVALFTPVENNLASGSGTVIHEDGYVLTNNHVLPEPEGYALLPNSRPLRFRVVGRHPESDMAIVQLLDVKPPLPVVPMGRSDDLMNGESVVVAGNPGGRGTVYTSGIVSSRDILEGAPNALVMTKYVNSRRDRFIQFDAASNRGNSGGPLVNMEGHVIGIVSASFYNEQNVGLAIPMDRVRKQFHQMLEPELFHQKETGLQMEPLASSAVAKLVKEDSAAASAGMKPGDIIQSVNGRAVRHSMDWLLMLETLLPQNVPLKIALKRGEQLVSTELIPRERPPIESIDAPTAVPGLTFAFYHGTFNELPNFANLKPEREGVIGNPGRAIEEIKDGREDFFAIRMNGLLKIDQEGLYRLIIVSDDGSRVFLHDQLLIDHDGNHPPKPAGSLVRLKPGFHPITVEYFQGNGAKTLQLLLEPCESRQTISLEPASELTDSHFFHLPPTAAAQ